MISKTIGMCVAVVVLAATTSYASVNLVVDGDFALPSGGGSFVTVPAGNYIGGPTGWKVTQGSVDVIGGYWVSSVPNEQSVDVAGNSSGRIEQTIATTAHGTYLLTFDLAGNPDGLPLTKLVEVSFGGITKTFSFALPNGVNWVHNPMGWTQQSWILNDVPADSILAFKDVSGTAYGAAIANVSVTAVPEPSTIIAGAFLLLPFGVSAWRSVRRNRA